MIDFDPATHQYSVDGTPYVSNTQMLEALHLTPPFPETDEKGLKDLGSAIHHAVELAAWDRLDFSATSQELIPYVEGFLEKKREMRIRPIATELRLWCPLYGVAGTLDLFCFVYDDELAVVDYKSGTPASCTELQTAGYVNLLRRMFERGELQTQQGWFPIDRSGAPDDYRKVVRRFSMKLTPGRAIVKPYEDPLDFHAWEGAVQLYKWKQRRKVSIETLK